MSTPVENNSSSREHFQSEEELAEWYEALVRYAATARPGNRYFHGPHRATVPVDLDRVRLGLTWLRDNHSEELARIPLPTLVELRAALDTPTAEEPVTIADPGSPLHNFWHWVNG
jgi:hypothetical protein